MFRHLSFILLLLVISLFLGCQGRSLLIQSDNYPSVQAGFIITSEPSMALVEIDGKYLGVTPIRLGGTKVGIEPGERTVVISSGDGYNLETVVEGSGSVSQEPDKEYYSVFRQEDRLLIEEGKILTHHIVFEIDQVELTAEAKPGWSFNRWEGDVEGTENPVSLEMDGDKKVTAILTYEISGVVKDELRTGIGGVEISFSGGYDMVTTEDDGKWSKEGLRGKVIVTPSKDSYSFNPKNSAVEGPSREIDFTGRYEVTGVIEDKAGHGIEGVEVIFSGGYESVITGEDGSWSKGGLSGNVTVTPNKDGYEFDPTYQEVTGPSDEVDFTGSYEVLGFIEDGAGQGIVGVEITFSDGHALVTTKSDGGFSKGGLSGSVTVTPNKDGYVFTPESREVSGPSTEVDFTGGYEISGSIVDGEGNGIVGIKVSFSGGHTSVTTGSDGVYCKGGLSGRVEVAPSKGGYSFNPSSREVTGADSNVGFIGTPPPPEAGDRTSHMIKGINFYMRLAPASTFPTRTDNSSSATVDHDFWVAETQVTYELWYTVRQWALDNGYTFSNAGREGSHGNTGQAPSNEGNEPVTYVNWYDSIVWCNALSEILRYNPVYTYNGVVIKSATGIDHIDVVAEDRNGFRLPTSQEWELAARYKGSDISHGAIEYPVGSGNYWTSGNFSSGAIDDYTNATETQAAAWYSVNSGGKTQDVGHKPLLGNSLGVFDMSGNVWEWCFTLTPNRPRRVRRGGSWNVDADSLQVGYAGNIDSLSPGNVRFSSGLRFLRTHF